MRLSRMHWLFSATELIISVVYHRSVLYVDDTLIVDEHCELAQICTDTIASQRHYYGLVFNWSKLEYMWIRCSPFLVQLDRLVIKCFTTMKNHIQLLSKYANITSELGLRIGYATYSVSNLQRIWSHANFSIRYTFALLRLLILSKLQYALETAE